jgi:quinate dehydrogenase
MSDCSPLLVRIALPHLTAAGSLIHLRHPDQVEDLLAQKDSPRVLMIVGAIPSFAPVTKAERMVYTTVSSVLSIPYNPPVAPPGSLPIPTKRLFLEMAYKPRITPMVSPERECYSRS